MVASVHVRTIRPESGQTANRRVVPYPQYRCIQRRILRDQQHSPRALLQHFTGKHSAGSPTRPRMGLRGTATEQPLKTGVPAERPPGVLLAIPRSDRSLFVILASRAGLLKGQNLGKEILLRRCVLNELIWVRVGCNQLPELSLGEKRYCVVQKIKDVLVAHLTNCTPDLLPIQFAAGTCGELSGRRGAARAFKVAVSREYICP